MRIEVVLTEPSRALVNPSSGATDGEVVRIGLVGDRYPELVRVDVPQLSVVTHGYTNRQDLRDRSLADFEHLRAGHVRGAFIGEIAARGFAEVWPADEPEQLFEMLKRGRLDLVFVREVRAREMIARFKLDGAYPVPSSRKTSPFYHYLHERHRDLVPRVENALRKVMSMRDGHTGEEPS